MNILLINHHAGSPEHGMEYRPFYFAREWVRAGHRVLILAASFSHLRRANPSFSGCLMRETLEDIEYLWVRTPSYQGNGPGRVRNMAEFMVRLRTACARPVEAFRPDLVIASSTYTWDNWIAARYARASGAKYIYELHDLWPLTLIELAHMSPKNPFIWSLQRAEDFACRHADRVVSILPAAAPHLVEHGMLPERFVHVPNGIIKEEWEARVALPEHHQCILDDLRSKCKCLVGYAGGMNYGDTLDVLVEAGADPQLRNIGIVCVGDGPERQRLQEKAKTLGSTVRFLSSVPKNAVPALLDAFDILYIGWARSPLYRYGISPNKLYEYMMAAVPILCAIEAANDPVAEAHCGLSIPPEDITAVCEGVLALAALPEQERQAMGARGRQYVEENHQVSSLARRFLDYVA